ncbi:MAG TPA: hypothetical protein VLH09_07065 [Bryobacteraceae bacterium]|nr:hypothetical protein [Bryobacteraceae bacterium]
MLTRNTEPAPNPDHECVEQNVGLTLEDYQRLTAQAEQGDPEGWKRIASDHFNAAAHWREAYAKERRLRLMAQGTARAAVWFSVALALAVVVGVVLAW